jgi:HPt (histidine-containing phosphotransfer) domain-containing protein
VCEHEDPLVSAEVLRLLKNSLEDQTIYRDFISQYIELWPQRYERLVSTVRSGDTYRAVDAVLSVKSAGQMLGAGQLSRLGGELEDRLRNGVPANVDSLLEEVARYGQRTVERLREELAAREPAGTLASDKSPVRRQSRK